MQMYSKSFWWMMALAALMLFIKLGSTSIFIIDEARNAECAREMLEQNEMIVPTYNYQLRTDKPPLHYFFMMGSYAVFGVQEWTARLFSVFMGLLTLLVTYFYSKKYKGEKTALYSMGVLMTSFLFMNEFRLAVPDPYLIFLMSWSLFLFIDNQLSKSTTSIWLFYITLGLAVLSKGPVALGLIGLIVLIYMIINRKFTLQFFREIKFLRGTLLFLLTAIPWYILVHQKTDGAWTQGFFFDHNINRFSDKMEGHGGIFLKTWFFVVLGMFPTSLLLIPAFRKIWTQRKEIFFQFLMIISVVIIIFFMASSTKLPHYTMPAYPFLAIIIGDYLSKLKFSKRSDKWNFKIWNWVLFILTFVASVGGYYILELDKNVTFLKVYLPFLIPVLIGLGVALYFIRLSKDKSLIAIFSTFVVFFMLIQTFILPQIGGENPALLFNEVIEEDKAITYYQSNHQAFPFYLKRQVPTAWTDDNIDFYIKNHPKGYIISQTRNQVPEHLIPLLDTVLVKKEVFEKPTTIIYQVK